MLYFNKQYVTVWEVKDHETYAVVRFSSSRKDTKDGSYKNSGWSFVKFVKNAYTPELLQLPKNTRIVVDGGLSKEEYVDDSGNRAWPLNPQFVVFHWAFPEDKPKADDGRVDMDAPPALASDEDDEDPF